MSTQFPETARRTESAQVQASSPDRSVWVSANAGTGKTRVLTTRIILLLLAGVPAERILCLTFTKAAAAEMINRLTSQLAAWAVLEDDALQESFRNYTGRPLEPDNIARARRLFAQVTDTPEGLKIRTIHSFCESLLGRFPLEARVAPHFQVADERTAAGLRMEARDQVLQQAARDETGDLARALTRLAALVNEDGFQDLMQALDAQRQRFAQALRDHGGLLGLGDALARHLGLAPGETSETLRQEIAARADGPAITRAADALMRGSAKDQDRAAALKVWLALRVEDRIGQQDDYVSIFLTAKNEPRKTLATKKVVEADPQAEGILRQEQDRLVQLIDKIKAGAILENTLSLVRVAEATLTAYERLKQDRALLDYDDLILKTLSLLSRDAAGIVSWVHYKLDGGIAHILVDEAQDTGPEAWDIIKTLADEFFSGLGAWDEEAEGARTVFAVGDEKQSIYSFQGADPAGFDASRAYFAERARDAGAEAQTLEKPVQLNVSFRSTYAVLNAVDQCFADEDAVRALSASGLPIRHIPHRSEDPGRVELWPVVTPEEEEEDDDPWDAPLDRPPRQAPLVTLARSIAGVIHGWLLDGDAVLEGTGTLIRPGDILILVRRRGAFVEEMVRALKERGIPVAGSDRMILTEQLAVMDLMALGRFALLPEDDLTLATVLKGPFCNLDDDDLIALCPQRKGSLWRELSARADEDPRWRDARDRLSGWLAQADTAPPFEFYSTLLGPGGGRRDILARLGPDALDPVEEFLNLSLAFERENTPSLQGFLAWLAAGGEEVKRDMEQTGNQVRVMTVHGSKGLEAPIVFLPDTCPPKAAKKTPALLWQDDLPFWPTRKEDDSGITRDIRDGMEAVQAEEELRLLYVAMTRARDRLYVCGWEGVQGRRPGCWYDRVEAGLTEAGAQALEAPTGQGLVLQDPGRPRPRADTAATTKEVPLRPDWLRQPAPTEPTPPRPLAPTRPDEEPATLSPLVGIETGRFKRGILIHKLLETLPELPTAQRAEAGLAYLKRPTHGLETAEAEALMEEVSAVLSHPQAAAVFGPGSRAEVPLIGLSGTRVISARIDRLVVTDDAVSIVDFKTNRPPPHRPEDVAPAYLAQLAGYRSALRSLYPNHRIECVLIWTDGPMVMPIPDQLIDPMEQ